MAAAERDNVQYGISLGTRPRALASLEAKIWQIVCSVAAGRDAVVGLSELFEDFNKITASGVPLQPDWFTQGSLVVVRSTVLM
jgi:hypothetical protein